MDPLIGLTFDRPDRQYGGGDSMHCEYQIDAVAADDIAAVEVSILWQTEGKGETDLGVHVFKRITPTDVDEGDLRPLGVLDTVLPASPLSYDGLILKIRWSVRIRLFLSDGREFLNEQFFTLGAIPPATPVVEADETDDTGKEPNEGRPSRTISETSLT